MSDWAAQHAGVATALAGMDSMYCSTGNKQITDKLVQ